jgi:hypothetical protein
MLGDHIRALKDGHWLHGIDLGDQRVLYLVETPGLAPVDRLRRVYRPEFTAGARKVELVVHREPAYASKAVVARAWSRFMDPSVIAMFRDSEAFAAWCKIGRLPETPATEPAPAPRTAARPAARRPVAGKPAARKPVARKAAARKPPAKRTPSRKSVARKAPSRKAAPKPSKAPPRKATPKKKGRR